MSIEDNIRDLHKEIQQNIIVMLPGRYKKLCLYASVIDGYSMSNGEMFFYYFPSGIIKKNPINVYEIPKLFDFDDQQYAKLEKRLYDSIKKLRQYSISIGENPWSNLTIIMEGTTYSVEYNYDDLFNSEFDNYSRHIIWRYKYLDIPIESYSRKEREIIERYFDSEEYRYSESDFYKENVYDIQINKVTMYDSVENDDIYVKTNLIEEEKNRPRSQLVTLTENIEYNKNDIYTKKDIIIEPKRRVKSQLLNNALEYNDKENNKNMQQTLINGVKKATKNQLLNF